MKNEMKNAFYTCPYCNEEYSEPADLAHCILSCEEKKKKEEEDRKREQLALEKDAREKEIEAAERHLRALIADFVKDYGAYSAKRKYDGADSLFWRWFV